MTSAELVKLLTSNGWQEVRQKGSHLILKHEDNPDNLSVPMHGKKDVAPGLLNALLKKAGLK
jgi:predicted RNA binding protein YcfA (HicA-like mRNA interferase family)